MLKIVVLTLLCVSSNAFCCMNHEIKIQKKEHKTMVICTSCRKMMRPTQMGRHFAETNHYSYCMARR